MRNSLLPLLLLCHTLGAWQPYAEVDGRFGNYRKGAGIGGWMPMAQDGSRLLFAQGALGNYRDVWGGSIGFGYRQFLEPWIAGGVNIFGDIARSTPGVYYAQGGLGVELFGECWLARANGYLTSHRIERFFKRNSSVFTVGVDLFSADKDVLTRLQAYNGFDAEIGFGVGGIWGYGGYFRYTGSEVPVVEGPRFRLEWFRDNIASLDGARLTLSAEWEWNERHGSTVAGYVTVRFPLGGRNPICGICRLMGDPVHRNRTIWVDTHDTITTPIVDLNSQIIFVEEGGTGIGTQTDPTNLPAATAAAGANDIIFLLNDTGTISASPVTLATGEQLYGFDDQSSVDITVTGGRTLMVTDLTGTGRATLDVAAAPVILGDDSTVFGITLDKTGAGAALTGTGVSRVRVVKTNITMGGTGAALALSGVTGGRISQVNVANSGNSRGFLVNGSSSDVDLLGITSTGSVDIAVELASSTNLNLSGFTTSGSTDSDLFLDTLSGSTAIASATITSAADRAIRIENGSANIDFLQSSLTQVAGINAVYIDSETGSIDMAGLAIDASMSTSAADPAILITTSSAPIHFDTVTLDTLFAGQRGIDANTNTGAISFEDVTIDGVSGVPSIDLSTNSGPITFDALAVTGSEQALSVTDQTALLSVNASTLASLGDTVIDFDNVIAAVTVDTLTSNRGVRLVDTTGSVTISDGTITSLFGTAFEVTGSAPDVSYTGTITNTVGDFITVTSTLGGTQSFVGSSSGALSSTTLGINLSNVGGNVSVRNASVSGPFTGALLSGVTGAFTLQDSSITAMDTGIDGTDVNRLTVRNTDFSGGSTGVNLLNTAMDGTWVFDQTTSFSAMTDALLLSGVGASDLTITCSDLTTASTVTNDSINVAQTGVGGDISMTVSGCTLNGGGGQAILIATDATSESATLAANISGNTFGATAAIRQALLVNVGSTATGGNTLNLLFGSNTNVNVAAAASAVALNSTASNSTWSVAYDNNTITSGDVDAIFVNGISGSATGNVTMNTNTQTATGPTGRGYAIETAAAFSGTLCTTLTDNNSNQTTGILLNAGGGAIQVTDLTNLSTNNNGITVSNTGAVTRATACPLPVVPPLP